MKKILIAIVINLAISNFAMAESVFFTIENENFVQEKCTLKKWSLAPDRFFNQCVEVMQTGTFQVSAVDTCLKLGASFIRDWDEEVIYCLGTIRDKKYSEESIDHCNSKKAGAYLWQTESGRIMNCLEDLAEK